MNGSTNNNYKHQPKALRRKTPTGVYEAPDGSHRSRMIEHEQKNKSQP